MSTPSYRIIGCAASTDLDTCSPPGQPGKYRLEWGANGGRGRCALVSNPNPEGDYYQSCTDCENFRRLRETCVTSLSEEHKKQLFDETVSNPEAPAYKNAVLKLHSCLRLNGLGFSNAMVSNTVLEAAAKADAEAICKSKRYDHITQGNGYAQNLGGDPTIGQSILRFFEEKYFFTDRRRQGHFWIINNNSAVACYTKSCQVCTTGVNGNEICPTKVQVCNYSR